VTHLSASATAATANASSAIAAAGGRPDLGPAGLDPTGFDPTGLDPPPPRRPGVGLRMATGGPPARWADGPPGSHDPGAGDPPDPDDPAAAPEVALVRRAQAGDTAAFETLVRGTARMLYARLYLDTGDRDQADDLLQDTYLTAWRSIGQLRDVPDATAFRRWLFAVARTARLDAARREGRKKRGGSRAGGGLRLTGASAAHDDLLAGLNDPGPPPDERLDRQERQDHALALLRSLPEEYRLPIAMRYLSGAEYDTICQQLGLSNGSLRGLLGRGMAKLRLLLRASGEEGE
jgi:RNA polymerase sigma-70 factor (ECF subfamily)